METITKIVIGGVIAALLATTIKSSSKELALVLSLAACAIMLIPGMRMLEGMKGLMDTLQEESGLERAVFTPMIRVCAIGLISQMAAYFCQDAGENTIAKVIELCGSIAALCAAKPIIDLVLELLRGFLGG